MDILEALASGLLNYSRSEPEGLLARGLRQPAGLLGRGLNSLDRGLSYTPPVGLLADQQRFFNPSVMATPQERAEQGRQFVQNVATGPLGLAPIGWTAYHGSPHKFDKFSMDRIGTGEGAQAYGHGLYFADNPEVAKTYSTVQRPMLDRLPMKDGKPYKAKSLAEFKAANVLQATGDYEKALARLEKDMDGLRANVRPLNANGRGQSFVEIGDDVARELQDLQQAKAALFNLRESGVSVGPDLAPNLYKVDIDDARAPKEAFLDWDKPLSQQSESVKKALKNSQLPSIRAMLGGMRGKSWADESVWPYFTGKDLMQELNGSGLTHVGNKDASEALRKTGIPGIRYLDAGSRANGGTYNTVLFDDSLVKILARE